jgi:hypothetical protein
VVEYLGYTTTSAFSFSVAHSPTTLMFDYITNRQDKHHGYFDESRTAARTNTAAKTKNTLYDKGGQLATKTKDIAGQRRRSGRGDCVLDRSEGRGCDARR